MIAWLFACADDPPPPPAACDPAVTWDSFGRGWLQTWCTTCHSSTLLGDARAGAPAGLNFDTWPDVVASRELIAAVATGDAPSMPPGGGPPPAERETLAAWLACGAPGTETVPVGCESPRPIIGDVTVTDGDDLCVDGNAVTGDLTLTGGSAACLCSVTGDLVTTSEVALPALTSVGGSLTAVSFEAPLLSFIGGDVAFTGENTRVPALVTVGGSFAATGANNLDVFRLRSVGGDLSVTAGGLASFASFGSLTDVGGALTLADLDQLSAIDGFDLLVSVGGPVAIERLPALVAIEGFQSLPSAVSLSLADLPSLTATPGFSALQRVDGEWLVERTGLSGAEPHGFVTEAGALLIRDNPALLELGAFSALARTDRLEITGNPLLPAAVADAFAARVEADVVVVRDNGT